MKKRRFMNNKAYTLVEMIIVIAIIAVLTTAALATISIMNTARAKEAATTFYTEINSLHSRAMNEMPTYDANHNGVVDPSERDASLYHGIMIHKDGNKIYAKKAVSSDGVNVGGFDVIGNANDGKGTSLSSYVNIFYTPVVGSRRQVAQSSSHPSAIIFNKAGECLVGYGTYEFCKKNGSTIATVTIKKNGSCQIK